MIFHFLRVFDTLTYLDLSDKGIIVTSVESVLAWFYPSIIILIAYQIEWLVFVCYERIVYNGVNIWLRLNIYLKIKVILQEKQLLG